MAAVSDLGIDLGSSSTLVYVRGKGVVLREPSIVAFDKDANKVKAVGEEAKGMLERTGGNLIGIRPIRKGVMTDYTVTEFLLRHFINKALGRMSFRKPRLSISVPCNLTQVEKKAVEDAAYQAGAREVVLVPVPVAAAIGAGIDISRPCGNMIVDIGAGLTEIAVVSLDGIVVSNAIPVAGDNFDISIMKHIRKAHSLVVAENLAENIKMQIGCAYERPDVKFMEVNGRDANTGLPKSIRLTSEEIREAMLDPLSQIVDAVHNVLERIPPELAADVADRGMVLTGGSALLGGLDELIEEKTGINTIAVEDPMTVAASGTGRFVELTAGNTKLER